MVHRPRPRVLSLLHGLDLGLARHTHLRHAYVATNQTRHAHRVVQRSHTRRHRHHRARTTTSIARVTLGTPPHHTSRRPPPAHCSPHRRRVPHAGAPDTHGTSPRTSACPVPGRPTSAANGVSRTRLTPRCISEGGRPNRCPPRPCISEGAPCPRSRSSHSPICPFALRHPCCHV